MITAANDTYPPATGQNVSIGKHGASNGNDEARWRMLANALKASSSHNGAAIAADALPVASPASILVRRKKAVGDGVEGSDVSGRDYSISSSAAVARADGDVQKRSKAERNRRRVTFHKAVRAKFTLHVNNYTEREKQNVWYSAEEIAGIRSEARTVVQAMQQRLQQPSSSSSTEVPPSGSSPSSSASSYTSSSSSHPGSLEHEERGLECRTKQGLRLRQRLKSKARSTVLEEQRAQQLEGVHFPDTIARVYRMQNKESERIALETGRSDETVARRIRRQDHQQQQQAKFESSLLATSQVLDEVMRTINDDSYSPSHNNDNHKDNGSAMRSNDSVGSFGSTISSPSARRHNGIRRAFPYIGSSNAKFILDNNSNNGSVVDSRIHKSGSTNSL